MLDFSGIAGKLNTLLSSWTSTLATNLATAITNIATLLTNCGATRMAKIDSIYTNTLSGGGDDPTVQRGAATFTNTTTQVIASLSAVTMNKAELRIVGVQVNGVASSDPAKYMVRGKITSTTQATFNRFAGVAGDEVIVEYEVKYW